MGDTPLGKSHRRQHRPRVNLELNDRVNLDVAVNLKVRVKVDVIVKFLDPVAAAGRALVDTS